MRAKITFTALFVYGAAVLARTVLPLHRQPADEPWWTVIHWIPGEVDVPSFVLNVIMFIPYGVLLPLLWPAADSARRLTVAAVAASASIEVIQLVAGIALASRRTVDVNDVIANTAGALIGLALLRLALPPAAHRRLIRP